MSLSTLMLLLLLFVILAQSLIDLVVLVFVLVFAIDAGKGILYGTQVILTHLAHFIECHDVPLPPDLAPEVFLIQLLVLCVMERRGRQRGVDVLLVHLEPPLHQWDRQATFVLAHVGCTEPKDARTVTFLEIFYTM